MTKVRELPKYKRPREKLERYGPVKLENHELLAILLGSGFKGVNAMELSKRILTSLDKDSTVEKLKAVKGLGSAKASKIIAMLELGRRLFGPTIGSELTPEKVYEECGDVRNSRKEHFVVFYLDSRNVSMAREIISVGLIDSSLVHPREVFEPALRYAASSIVIAHNHPTGNVEPSTEDIEITKKLIHAGKLLDIRIQDHVIVSKAGWMSLRASREEIF